MSPTRITVWLLVAGAVLGLGSLVVPILPSFILDHLPAWLYHAGQWLALGFDAFILALFLLDAAAAKWLTRGGRLRVRRERPARLSLGVDNDVTLVIDNHAPLRLRLTARDEAPTVLRADPRPLHAATPPHG